MPRERLPNRRPNRTLDVVHDGTTYAVTIGFDPVTDKVREVFTHGAKVGSAMDGILDDACILLSILLQHGVDPASLVATMGRLGEAEQSASIIGILANRLVQESQTQPDAP